MNETRDIIEQARTEIVPIEERALERWCQGDPSGFLEASAPDVSYFDPFLSERVDGLEQLGSYYEGLRGQVSAPKHEMIEPRVQLVGGAAVLTFRFVSTSAAGDEARWNCTEVYGREGSGWQIVHTHWSRTADV